MLIEVRPIPHKRWHGKEGEDSIQRPIKLNALVDPHSREYATGLSYSGIYDHPGNEEGLTEAEYYGKLLGQDLHPRFNQNSPHPFWDSTTASVKLDNKPIFLNTDRPLDYVRWKVLKASRFVANSMKEYNEGLFPDATHVLYNEIEAEEEKATKIALKQQIINRLYKMTAEDKQRLATVLTGRSLKKQSASYVDIALDEETNSHPNKVLRYLEMDRLQLSAHSLVLEALYLNVLRQIKYQIFYMDEAIGNDIMDVVDFLIKPENQEIRLRITAAVNS